MEKQPLLPRVKEKKLTEESRGPAEIQSPGTGQVIPRREEVEALFSFYPQEGGQVAAEHEALPSLPRS